MSQSSRKLQQIIVSLARKYSAKSKTRPRPRPSASSSAGLESPPPTSNSNQPVPINSLQQRDDWIEVRDEKTNQIYYWNKSTDETTALGEPRPGPDGRRRQVAVQSSSLGSLVVMGAGVGLVFALLSRIF